MQSPNPGTGSSTGEAQAGVGVGADGQRVASDTGRPTEFKVEFGRLDNESFRAAFANFLREEGYTAESIAMKIPPSVRKTHPPKLNWEERTNKYLKHSVEVQDILLLVVGGLVVGMVWEGVRYVFRNKIKLPGYFELRGNAYVETTPTGGTVRQMRTTTTTARSAA